MTRRSPSPKCTEEMYRRGKTPFIFESEKLLSDDEHQTGCIPAANISMEHQQMNAVQHTDVSYVHRYICYDLLRIHFRCFTLINIVAKREIEL